MVLSVIIFLEFIDLLESLVFQHFWSILSHHCFCSILTLWFSSRIRLNSSFITPAQISQYLLYISAPFLEFSFYFLFMLHSGNFLLTHLSVQQFPPYLCLICYYPWGNCGYNSKFMMMFSFLKVNVCYLCQTLEALAIPDR